MPFDTTRTFPLRPGLFTTRDGARAEVFAVRRRYDDTMIAIGCVYSNFDGSTLSATEWNAENGCYWIDGESPSDIVAVAV